MTTSKFAPIAALAVLAGISVSGCNPQSPDVVVQPTETKVVPVPGPSSTTIVHEHDSPPPSSTTIVTPPAGGGSTTTTTPTTTTTTGGGGTTG